MCLCIRYRNGYVKIHYKLHYTEHELKFLSVVNDSFFEDFVYKWRYNTHTGMVQFCHMISP